MTWFFTRGIKRIWIIIFYLFHQLSGIMISKRLLDGFYSECSMRMLILQMALMTEVRTSFTQ